MLRGLLTVWLADLGLLSRPEHLWSRRCWRSRPASPLRLHLPEHMHASASVRGSQHISCRQDGETRREDGSDWAQVSAKESDLQ